MVRTTSKNVQIRPDRAALRWNSEKDCWDLIELQSEGEDLLVARFFAGSKYSPSHLAHWALEEVKTARKA